MSKRWSPGSRRSRRPELVFVRPYVRRARTGVVNEAVLGDGANRDLISPLTQRVERLRTALVTRVPHWRLPV